jgi:flagellin-like protein
MKRFRRSKKALSPVVASIILIAVTVAVSIAVAAWMGALSVGFMQTEQLSITSATFGTNTVVLGCSNTGTTSVKIDQAWNSTSTQVTPTFGGGFSTTGALAANTNGTVTLPCTVVSGNNYAFKLVSSKGTTFTYTAVAP